MELLDKNQFITIDNKHSNVSIKIVIPAGCNAKCEFCFNQLQKDTRMVKKEIFLANLSQNLDYVLTTLKELDRDDISLDITGNETTFDVNLLKATLRIVSEYKNRVKRVVLTTNGFKLKEIVDFLSNEMLDYVNISSHHYDFKRRKLIFKTDTIPDDETIKYCTSILEENGIKTTSVVVLYKKLDEPFMDFMNKFSKWSVECGFSGIRVRSNFTTDNAFIREYFENTSFENVVSESEVAGLYTKNIVMNNIPVRLLRGVNDLTNYVIGVEGVIDDNGQPYVDYNKRFAFNDHLWVYKNVHIAKR